MAGLKKPRVSIVMSVYNFNRSHMQGIESMLSQSMEDFEFILVDDGSNEQTRKRLEEYANSDSRITLIVNEKRLRLASSLNRAIRRARTDYIARADVNISYHVDRLRIQYEFIEKHPAIHILGSNFYWGIDGQNGVTQIVMPHTHEEIIKRMSFGCSICHPSVVYRKNRLMPYGPYQEGFGWGEDYHLWMRVRDKMQFHNLQAVLLTKWHRPEPWKGRIELSRFGYFKGELQSRMAGLFTSPSIWIDITSFPMVFMSFISETWLHDLFKFLKRIAER